MSSKINVWSIIRGHFWTLKDASTGKFSFWDILLFIGFPIVLAIYSSHKTLVLSDNIISNLITIGVLLSALLLNLLVIVYTLKDRLPKVDNKVDGWERLQLKHRVMTELYYNISASVITSFAVLIFSLMHNMLKDITGSFQISQTTTIDVNINGNIIDPIVVLFFLNVVFTFLMIIKRTYLLLVNDEE